MPRPVEPTLSMLGRAAHALVARGQRQALPVVAYDERLAGPGMQDAGQMAGARGAGARDGSVMVVRMRYGSVRCGEE